MAAVMDHWIDELWHWILWKLKIIVVKGIQEREEFRGIVNYKIKIK